MKNKGLAVCGTGFVGGSLATVFAEKENFEVFTYDKAGVVPAGAKFPNGLTPAKSIKELVEACNERGKSFSHIYFVAVPTPMFEDGSPDLSIVRSVLQELADAPKGPVDRIAVIKSTVPPSSTEKWNEEFASTSLQIVFNPEFLREISALEDMRHQSRIILGGPKQAVNRVRSLYAAAFPDTPIIKTSSTIAELTKYTVNCFLAIKLSYANELFQYCSALEAKGFLAEYDRLIECVLTDPRMGTSHWRVPSFETDDNGNPLKGWGLSCFTKDINALIHSERNLGVEPTMLEAAWKKNLEVRPQRDWERLLGRAVSRRS